MPSLHEHCRARTIYPNHRKIREKEKKEKKEKKNNNNVSLQNELKSN